MKRNGGVEKEKPELKPARLYLFICGGEDSGKATAAQVAEKRLGKEERKTNSQHKRPQKRI